MNRDREKEIEKERQTLLTMLIMGVSLIVVLIMTFYPVIKNVSDKTVVFDEINKEIEMDLKAYSESDDYVIINPSVELDKKMIEESTGVSVSNIEDIDNLSRASDPYIYITRKTNGNNYEVFEAYRDVTINGDNTFTVSPKTLLKSIEIFTYEDGEFSNKKTIDYDNRISEVGNIDMGNKWIVSVLGVIILSSFLIIRVSSDKEDTLKDKF